MRQIIILLLLLFIPLPVPAASFPSKVKLEYETGKRYIPEDSDYTEEDANVESSFAYDINKINLTRKFSERWYISISAKNLERRYDLFSDLNLNAKSDHLFGFLRCRNRKDLLTRLEWNWRKKDYNDPASLADNRWLALGAECKWDPDISKTNVFLDGHNTYSVSYINKLTEFSRAAERNNRTHSLTLAYSREVNDRLRVNVRGNSTKRDYRRESVQRIDSAKESVNISVEYEF